MTVSSLVPSVLNPAHTTQFLPQSYPGGIRPSRTTVFKQQMIQRRDSRLNKIKNWWNDINRLYPISRDLPPYVSMDFVDLLALKSALLDKEYYESVMASRISEFFTLFIGAALIIIILLSNLTRATLISSCITLAMLQLMHIGPSALGVALVSSIQTEVLMIWLLRVNYMLSKELTEQLLISNLNNKHGIFNESEYATAVVLSVSLTVGSVVLPLFFLCLLFARGFSRRRQVVSTLHMIMRDLDTNYKPIWHSRSRTDRATQSPPPAYSSDDEDGENGEQSRV